MNTARASLSGIVVCTALLLMAPEIHAISPETGLPDSKAAEASFLGEAAATDLRGEETGFAETGVDPYGWSKVAEENVSEAWDRSSSADELVEPSGVVSGLEDPTLGWDVPADETPAETGLGY